MRVQPGNGKFKGRHKYAYCEQEYIYGRDERHARGKLAGRARRRRRVANVAVLAAARKFSSFSDITRSNNAC